MNWTELLKTEIDNCYKATEGLLNFVEDDSLGWKPDSGNNWMTTGQLLKHITDACGACMRGFVTGDWGMPDGVDLSEMPLEEMLPPAEKMASVGSLDEAKELLAKDQEIAIKMVEEAGEERLQNETVAAPWDPTELRLGHQLLNMVGHLASHKSQLFYYLKLQGKPVNTQTLWGM